MERHQGIANYLSFISETYHIEICINDFVGFLNLDENLHLLLQPFLIHKNPYCMQIKSNRKLWNRCLAMKRRIFQKAQRLKSSYCGMCYCGIEEYIVPIICKNFVIGVICAGEYSNHPAISSYRIRKIAHENKMDQDLLLSKFSQSVRKETDGKALIDNLLGIVAENLAGLYESSKLAPEPASINEIGKISSESYVLSHAVEYVKQHFHENINVKEVAVFCHCSESYMSHIFKNTMKVNIKPFINRLRVEQAKRYLLNSGDTIAEISSKVGFNDSNYFSSVFKKIAGIPPTEYKKRFTIEKQPSFKL